MTTYSHQRQAEQASELLGCLRTTSFRGTGCLTYRYGRRGGNGHENLYRSWSIRSSDPWWLYGQGNDRETGGSSAAGRVCPGTDSSVSIAPTDCGVSAATAADLQRPFDPECFGHLLRPG